MESATPIEMFRASLTLLLKDMGHGSQARLADSVGMDRAYLNGIVKGRNNGSEDLREKLAQELGYTYEGMIALGRMLIQGEAAATQPRSGDFLDLSLWPTTLRSEIVGLLIKTADIITSTDQNRQTLTNFINSIHQSLRRDQDIADYKKKISKQEKRLANLEREMNQLKPIKEKKDIASL